MSDKVDRMSDSGMKDSRISVRLPAGLRRKLKTVAHRNRIRESDFVRGAVERQLAMEEDALTAYEHAIRARLIGATRRAKRDLSTNPRYFEGFGS